MRLSPYGSLIVAMVTPFGDDLQVDYQAAVRLCKAFVSQGADGVLISGTTGESPTLTNEEKVRLVSEVREALDPSVMVWAGAVPTTRKQSNWPNWLRRRVQTVSWQLPHITTNQARMVCTAISAPCQRQYRCRLCYITYPPGHR